MVERSENLLPLPVCPICGATLIDAVVETCHGCASDLSGDIQGQESRSKWITARSRRPPAAKAKDRAELRALHGIKLTPIKRILASLSRSLDGTGQQMETREVMLLATVAIESLEEMLTTLNRGNHFAVLPSIKLIRQAGTALLQGELDAVARIFLQLSEKLPEEVQISTTKVRSMMLQSLWRPK